MVLFLRIMVVVAPDYSCNTNLTQMSEPALNKIAIFQLQGPLEMSDLEERELIQNFITK